MTNELAYEVREWALTNTYRYKLKISMNFEVHKTKYKSTAPEIIISAGVAALA